MDIGWSRSNNNWSALICVLDVLAPSRDNQFFTLSWSWLPRRCGKHPCSELLLHFMHCARLSSNSLSAPNRDSLLHFQLRKHGAAAASSSSLGGSIVPRLYLRQFIEPSTLWVSLSFNLCLSSSNLRRLLIHPPSLRSIRLLSSEVWHKASSFAAIPSRTFGLSWDGAPFTHSSTFFASA
jgi:hypothetical protein